MNTGTEYDSINHPEHYNCHAMECIEEMLIVFGRQKTYDFCVLNAWKYRYRAGRKESIEEDMAKSDWYMAKAKELQGMLTGGDW